MFSDAALFFCLRRFSDADLLLPASVFPTGIFYRFIRFKFVLRQFSGDIPYSFLNEFM